MILIRSVLSDNFDKSTLTTAKTQPAYSGFSVTAFKSDAAGTVMPSSRAVSIHNDAASGAFAKASSNVSPAEIEH